MSDPPSTWNKDSVSSSALLLQEQRQTMAKAQITNMPMNTSTFVSPPNVDQGSGGGVGEVFVGGGVGFGLGGSSQVT